MKFMCFEEFYKIGFSREFTRKYHLPEGVDPLDVKCDLTADGILLISGKC